MRSAVIITPRRSPPPSPAPLPRARTVPYDSGDVDGRDGASPEPVVERMRGAKLVLVWTALALASWVVVGGAGYGLFALATAIFG